MNDYVLCRDDLDPLKEAKDMFKKLDFRSIGVNYSHDRQSYELDKGRIQGKVIYDVDEYEIIEVKFKAGTIVRAHFHNVVETHNIISGHVRLNIEEKCIDITPDAPFSIKVGVEHSIRAVTDTVALLIRKPTSGDHRTDDRRSETPNRSID